MTILQEIILTLEKREELEQLQHMLNMEEQGHRNLSTPSSDEDQEVL